MPHLTFEYSSNINSTIDFKVLFSDLHNILENNGININNCKSRAIQRPVYHIGDGNPQHGFIHLDLRFLDGRTKVQKNDIGQKCLQVLRDSIPYQKGLQISIEIGEINRDHYFKFPDNLSK